MKMRFNPSNWKSGMHGMLSGFSSSDNARLQTAMDDIRQAMLDCLGGRLTTAHPIVRLRVTYANDLQDLWYLRGDVMEALAAVDGEGVARRKLAHISEMFKGHLPRGLATRPSPLSS
jgi:hypothetical protein